MKTQFRRILLIALALCSNTVFSQETEEKAIHLISLGMGIHITAFDFGDRFGDAKSAQLSYEMFFPKGLIVGVDGGALFGSKVLEPNLGINLINDSGDIIGVNGFPAFVDPSLLGYKLQVNLGWGRPVKPESTWNYKAVLGLGFIQHKITFKISQDEVPQLRGEYVKGYDRLSNGFYGELNLGVLHLDENRLKNFYLGLQVGIGLTGERRSFNFDTQTVPLANRLDGMFGITGRWVLPIYRTPKDKYYYN